MIENIHENSWKALKPAYTMSSSSSDSDLAEIIFLVMGYIFAIIIYSLRFILLVFKPNATYWHFSLEDEQGRYFDFLHARSYGDRMQSVINEVVKFLNLPLKINKKVAKLSPREYLSTI